MNRSDRPPPTVTPELNAPDSPFDLALRPADFAEFQGQTKVKEQLLVMVEAAKIRQESLDHVLLCGPPGLGKTTLANLIASSVGSRLHSTSGPQIERAGDLAGLLTNLQERDILFIDEIHRLHPSVEEYLYPAIEDFRLDIIIEDDDVAFPWQNPINFLDVNGDERVTPLDVLVIINYLNRNQGGDLPAERTGPFVDTNGDNRVQPIDALLVMNFLNRRPEGEGETPLRNPASAVDQLMAGGSLLQDFDWLERRRRVGV